jgi:hypothetical protein
MINEWLKSGIVTHFTISRAKKISSRLVVDLVGEPGHAAKWI